MTKWNSYLLFFLWFLSGFSFATHFEIPYVNSADTKPATIKVLLHEMMEGAIVEVKGRFQVCNIENNKYLSGGRSNKRFFLFPHPDGLKWGETYPGVYQIRIVPLSSETTTLIDGIEYRGCIEVYNIEGKLYFVNEVDIESYIKSTLSTEFSIKPPIDILDSIAILARTNAYYIAGKNCNQFWHVYGTNNGYYGNANTLVHPHIDRSVDATKYLILTYEEKPFPTAWTENCAGKTASYSIVFQKNIATPPGITSEFAQKDRDSNQWKYTISVQEISRLLKMNCVTAIELFTDPSSNKVHGIQMRDGNHNQNLTFVQLQDLLGKKNIQSNDFAVSLQGKEFVFKGFGKGLGCGLCLSSAQEMVQRGDNTPQVLARFFPYTQLLKATSAPENFFVRSADMNEFFCHDPRCRMRHAMR